MRIVLFIAGLIAAACAAPNAEPAASATPAAATAAAAAAATAEPAIDAPDPVKPFPAGLRGELLFQSDREGPTRLFVLDLATAAIRRVGGVGDWLDEEPRWSPDGARIAFSSTRGQKGNLDIFVMNADGSNVVRLTDHAAPEQGPVWAADGQSLFFTGERDGRGEIYRVWLADRRVDRVTSGINRAIMPATSPDGRYLAYAAQTIMSFQLHLIDLTNGSSRQITSGGGACRPSFAPDSQEIAFVRLDREPSRIEAVRETGPRVLLEDKKMWSYYPDYSPDGRLIAFSVSPQHHEGEDWDLAIMDVQKPGQFVRLTTGRGNDRVPDWKPR
jgi:Tol biopolymer transport system component